MDAPADDDLTPEDVAAFARLPVEKRLVMRGAVRMAEALADVTESRFGSATAHLAQAEADFAGAKLMERIRAEYADDPDPFRQGMVDFAEHMLGGW